MLKSADLRSNDAICRNDFNEIRRQINRHEYFIFINIGGKRCSFVAIVLSIYGTSVFIGDRCMLLHNPNSQNTINARVGVDLAHMHRVQLRGSAFVRRINK